MPRRRLAVTVRIAASAALLLAAATTHDNWGSPDAQFAGDPTYAKSQATCRRLGDPKPPAADRPSPAEVRALKGCNSEKLYYGEGAKPDYVKARQCAFIEANGADDNPLGGSTILMQVYANGLGVTRNVDLATAYACQIDSAPAEYDGRITHLQALKTKPAHFDYCDDITSGFAEGFCASLASDQAAVGRDARLAAFAQKLPPAAQPLYSAMKKTFDAFVDARGDEVDQSGTARAAEEIGEQDAVRNQLLRDLARLTSSAWPVASASDARAADSALNASYRKGLVWAASKDNLTTVKADDIRKTQRVWLTYRDAFVRFAAAAAPSVSADAVTARLTKLRTAQLDQDSN